MKRILNIEIFDMFPHESGFIYSKKICTDEGRVKISYNTFLTESEESHHISRVAYLLRKFGRAYKNIANQLGDYVTCDCVDIGDEQKMVVFPSGEYGIFSQNGIVQSTGDLTYKGYRAHGICVDGENFWSVVPALNCIIRFSAKNLKVNMRIGSSENSPFERPEDVCIEDGMLYVSCAGSKSVKSVDLNDFSIEDYLLFDEAVWKYMRVGDNEIVLLNSGVYML